MIQLNQFKLVINSILNKNEIKSKNTAAN